MRYPFILLLSFSAVCAQPCLIPSERANPTKPAQKHLLADGFEDTPTKPIDPPDPIAEQPCTVILEKFPAMTVPTVWKDKGNGCDYLVKGRLLFENTVKIEPGVHVRFEKDASLVLEDGGSFIAVGTADKRIVFEGATHRPGFWSGIRIRGEKHNKKLSRMEYVDVRDAGRNPRGYFSTVSAIGTKDAPIKFLGIEPIAGWWAGISFGTKGNVLRHVEVANAGNTVPS